MLWQIYGKGQRDYLALRSQIWSTYFFFFDRYNVSRLSIAFNITGTTMSQLFFSFLNWVYSFVTSIQCHCIQLEKYTGYYISIPRPSFTLVSFIIFKGLFAQWTDRVHSLRPYLTLCLSCCRPTVWFIPKTLDMA